MWRRINMGSSLNSSHYKLNNLIVFLDKNGFQQTGETKDILLNENFFEKWNLLDGM